jgi:hypothetical protein
MSLAGDTPVLGGKPQVSEWFCERRFRGTAAAPVGLERPVTVAQIAHLHAEQRPASSASAESWAEYQGMSQPMKSR